MQKDPSWVNNRESSERVLRLAFRDMKSYAFVFYSSHGFRPDVEIDVLKEGRMT